MEASQVAQWVKNPPGMQEMQEAQVWSLGREDPLEESMATHSSILVWRIPWTEEPGRLQSLGSQRAGHNWSDWACMHAWGSMEGVWAGGVSWSGQVLKRANLEIMNWIGKAASPKPPLAWESERKEGHKILQEEGAEPWDVWEPPTLGL